MAIANKVALITGGAKGIGFHCAKELLKRNLRGVSLLDIDENEGRKAEKTLGGKSFFIKCDAANFKQLEEAFEKTVSKFKNLDIVVNNAAIIDEENWPRMIDINLNGIIHGTYLAVGKYFDKNRGGVVVHMSSIGGLGTVDPLPGYSTSKYAMNMFGRCYDLDGTKSKVFTLCPGVTDTDMQKMGDERFREKMKFLPWQSAEYVGEQFCELLERNPASGSIWVVEDTKPIYEFKYEDVNKMKVL